MTTWTFDDARAAVAAGTTPEEAAARLVGELTPEERQWCLDGDAPTWAGLDFMARDGYHLAPFLAARVERVGFPGVAFSDGPRGVVIGNGTCFPVAMARAATWDPDLEERVGEAIGRELRASGADLTGAVCVNVLRHPAWGRAQETYGEDPYHVGELGAAAVRGIQRHAMVSVKHLACNSMENARFTVDVEVDEVALHEIYLPHFRRIVDEGVAAVMSAYNSVNGAWCGQHRGLLTGVLREEWGFRGFVISDWILGLRDAVPSLAAGLDVEMPYRMVRARDLPAALASGEASWADVDAAVTRVVATRLRFDEVLSAPDPDRSVIGCTGHRTLAREVAARAAVLLRNEPVDGIPVLPLAPDAGQVAVVGRLAGLVNLGDGGSSDVWDLECTTVLDGLRVAYEEVVDDDGSDPDRAAAVAATATAAVVVVGTTYLDEGEFIGETDESLFSLFPGADDPAEVARFQGVLADLPPTTKPERVADRPRGGFGTGGDRTSLRLAPADLALVRAVAAANRRTVVVLQTGSAVVVDEWLDEVPALVHAWYGGSQAGLGLADVLTGVVNPSARLPFSVPADEGDLPPFERDATRVTYDRWHGWWHLRRIGATPTFPFGFGLSYTSFALGPAEAGVEDEGIAVRGTVVNTGDRDGTDVVQIYAELPDPDAPDRLVGFARVEVPAQATVPFEVMVPTARLVTRDPEAHAWADPAGRHRITVARHAGDPGGRTFDVDLAGPEGARGR